MRNLQPKKFIAPVAIAVLLMIAYAAALISGGLFSDESTNENAPPPKEEVSVESSSESKAETFESEEASDVASPDKNDEATKNNGLSIQVRVITLLSDCFTLPGALLMCCAAIGWIASFGLFDMLFYGTQTFLAYFIKPIAEKRPPNFYEYKKQKEEKGRGWSVETLIVGAGFFLVGMVFVVISFFVV